MLAFLRTRLTPQAVTRTAVVLAAGLTLFAGWRAVKSFGLNQRFTEAQARLTGETDTSQEESASQLQEDTVGEAALQRILDRHVFNPRPPQRFRSIKGVLGNQVVFADGTAVEAGGTYDGAAVKAIGGDWVELEHNGELVKVNVHGEGGSRGGGGGRRFGGGGMPPEIAAMINARGGGQGSGEGRRRRGGGRGFQMPEGMTPEQARAMFEQRRSERRAQRGGDNPSQADEPVTSESVTIELNTEAASPAD